MGTDPIAKAKSGTDHGFPLNLVLQAPSLEQPQVDEIAAMAQATQAERISPHAVRLRNAVKRDGIAARCDERRIDHAWMAPGRRVADLKLLAMDMDSTLITIECIDELGDLAGKKAEIAAITERAMRGELDFPGALRHRVAALVGLRESALVEVYEKRLKLTPGAETLVKACKDHGVKLLLVSGGFSFFTERLKARLGLDYTISNTLEIENGRLTGKILGGIAGAQAKARKFLEVMTELRARKEQTVAIGDGANDLEMMAEAGLSVAFHAKPVVRAQADCAINWSGLDAVVNLFE
jgi:phosphoserine phosphatase